MAQVVAAGAEFEAVVVAGEVEGGRHLLVGERPTAEDDVGVRRTALQKHAQGFAGRTPDQVRVVVAAANGGERPAMADHAAERLRAVPSGVEGADAAARDAADGTSSGIGGEGPSDGFLGEGQHLFGKETRIVVRHRVVLDAALIPAVPLARRTLTGAGRDEDADERIEFSGGDQVVEYPGGSRGTVAVEVERSVVEDDESGRIPVPFETGRRVDPHVSAGIRKHGTRRVAANAPYGSIRHIGPFRGLGAGVVVGIARRVDRVGDLRVGATVDHAVGIHLVEVAMQTVASIGLDVH